MLTKREMATTRTSSRLNHPVRRWVGLTVARRIPFRWKMSSKARFSRLKALAPMRLPTVKSGASTRVTALIPVKSSGSDVIAATTIIPIHTCPMPVLSAIISPYLATFFPEKKIINIQITSLSQTKVYLCHSCFSYFIGIRPKCQHTLLKKANSCYNSLILRGSWIVLK